MNLNESWRDLVLPNIFICSDYEEPALCHTEFRKRFPDTVLPTDVKCIKYSTNSILQSHY